MKDQYNGIKIEQLPVGTMQVNCYLVYDASTLEGIVVDPGDEGSHIMHRIQDLGLKITMIVLTHGHVDHIGGLAYVRRKLSVKVAIGKGDADMLTKADLNLSDAMGIPITNPPADILLSEGDMIPIGNNSLTVIETPGHTIGGISLVGEGFVICGDLLFAGSIGRVDLPGGAYDTIISVIKNKILVLDDKYAIFPGHGPETTVWQEKTFNPFLIEE
jgi:hydroxyacylglutathione hydrolase